MWSFIVTCPISGYARSGRQIFNAYKDNPEDAARRVYRRLLRDATYSVYLKDINEETFNEETFIDEVLSEGGMDLDNGMSVHIVHRADVIEL